MTFGRHIRLTVCLFAGTLSGCRAVGSSSSIDAQYVIGPDSTCTIAATNPILSGGTFDPTLTAARTGYNLSVVVRNNLRTRSEEPVIAGEITNLHESHDHAVRFTGLEACWYLANDSRLPKLRNESDGGLIECSSIPEQSSFLPADVSVDEQSIGVVTVNLLTPAHLQTLFGSTFDATQIPAEGAIAKAHDLRYLNDANVLSLAAESPADTTSRSAAWGANYPTTRNATVYVQVRAHGIVTSSHATDITDWILFPIEVCPGCLRSSCGDLQAVSCPRGPCPDGSPCLKGFVCANTQIFCAPQQLWSGTVYDPTALSACLPAQYLPATTRTCTPVGCDAAE